MRRLAWVALGLVLAGGIADARNKKADKDDEEDSGDDDKPDKKKADKKKDADKKDKDADKDKDEDASESSDASDSDSDDDGDGKAVTDDKGPNQQDKDAQKQDLTGHDLGNKKENEFEKDRFYVDKADSAKTEKGTLVQGSIASSSFFYTESGGNLIGNAMAQNIGSNAGKFSRYFEDLRLQTDFRHIGGGRWDARIDGRIRVVNNPGTLDPNDADQTHVQSGFNGTNEYEIREAWLVRNGIQSDVILGRQFIPDLGAVKIDGLRIDYASSRKLTLIGFGGLYPLRGSRSLTTDYPQLKDNGGGAAGRAVGAAGFGGAYRTVDAYGALGGVVLAPFAAESPRVFATANGYFRVSPQLDFYHFAIIDLLAQSGANVTAGTAGINYKPNQRLRMTAAFNRVDTDTLNVQAQAFLDKTDPTTAGNSAVQNEAFIQRLSTNQLRGSVSVGLGELQRFELSTAVTFRYRPGLVLTPQPVTGQMTAPGITLDPSKGVDLYASIVDRHSIKDARIGFDVVRTFGIGAVPYQRTEVQGARISVAHAIKDGQGEWEAEAAYAGTKDINAGAMCTMLTSCFGSTTNTILSLGGNVYYRINRDWFTLASLSVSRQATKSLQMNVPTTDPGIVGLSGFLRIAYRF